MLLSANLHSIDQERLRRALRLSISLLFLLCAPVLASAAPSISELSTQIREAGLDPAECYRVRDLDFTREDARFYLTEGYLIFGKAVAGRRFSAVFIGEVDGGDAEVLLFPPLRSERMSLAKFTESPNLNEHFRFAAFLFTDNTYEEIVRLIEERYAGRKVSEMGPLYAEKFASVVRNLSESLELRLVKDLAEQDESGRGFFFSSLRGNRLGNFDFILDPLARDSIRIGQFTLRETTPFFDTWTEFQPRSVASGQKPAPQPEYRIEHYDIEATLEPDLLLRATTRVRLVPLVKRSTIALLVSQNMVITAARSGGADLEIYRPAAMRLNTIRRDQDTAFLLAMPEGAEPNEPLILEIAHEGRVVDDSGNDVLFVGARGSWFPGAGHRFATYEVSFRVPKGLDFVSTCESVESSSDETGNVYRVSVKNPVRTFGFNVGKYKRTTAKGSGITVNVFANKQVESALEPSSRMVVVPTGRSPVGRRGTNPGVTVATMPALTPDPTRRLEDLAREVVSLIGKLSQRFGEPPVKTINVSPIPGNFGQGFAGMIYLSTLSYLPEGQRPPYAQDAYSKTFYSDMLLAHEIAHQWWGNLVYADSDQDEWIMEGLANYTSLMMLEEEKGRKAATEVLLKYRDNLLAELEPGRVVDDAGPILWGDRLINSRDRGAWTVITYEKGTWIFHMLRSRLGDESFDEMLREMPRRFEHKAITTSVFRSFAAEFMPKDAPDADLEEFFAQWVESSGIPRVAFSAKVTGKAPKVSVQASVKQSDVPDEFGALVPIHIRFSKGPEEIRWVRVSNDEEMLEWTFKSAPVRIELDPLWQTLRRD